MKIRSVYGDVSVGRTLVGVKQVGRPAEERLRVTVGEGDTYITLQSAARLAEHLLNLLARYDLECAAMEAHRHTITHGNAHDSIVRGYLLRVRGKNALCPRCRQSKPAEQFVLFETPHTGQPAVACSPCFERSFSTCNVLLDGRTFDWASMPVGKIYPHRKHFALGRCPACRVVWIFARRVSDGRPSLKTPIGHERRCRRCKRQLKRTAWTRRSPFKWNWKRPQWVQQGDLR